MKIKITSLILCLTIFIYTAPSFASANKVHEYTTQGGIKVWAIEDNYLPIVSVRIAFTKSGAAHDPENKQGLSSMVSDLMVEGAGGISGVEYMQKIEGLASTIGFGVDADNYYVSMTCLKESLDETLRLLSLAIKSPDFKPDAIERVRESILTNIARQDESADGKAEKVFRENYFAGHPYSRQEEGNEAGVKAITRADLVSFAKSHFARSNMVIGVVGSASQQEVIGLVDKYFLPLPIEAKNTREIPEFVASAKGKIIRVEKDVPQSTIIFGFPGPKRTDSDFYPTYITNYIIGGGGFESRLMKEVREKSGLAYSISTSLETYQKAGLIVGHVGTKNASVEESVKIIREEIRKLHEGGPVAQELKDSEDYLVGSFPMKLTLNSSLASFITAMQYDNLGIDFLDKRNNYIKDVDLKKANAAAAKYFDIDKMLVVIVGKGDTKLQSSH